MLRLVPEAVGTGRSKRLSFFFLLAPWLRKIVLRFKTETTGLQEVVLFQSIRNILKSSETLRT